MPPVVIFDIDGTLLDSAAGIVAGFRHALGAMGLAAPSEEELRSDLGPPVGDFLSGAGVPPHRLAEAVAAYRSFYAAEGMHQSRPYPGVPELLRILAQEGVLLGTATAKRTDTASAILALHGLATRFDVVNGTTDTITGKAETIAETLRRLGAVPTGSVMVGDRHSDISGAHACGLSAIGVTWGYGSRDELVRAGADRLVDTTAELLAALRRAPA